MPSLTYEGDGTWRLAVEVGSRGNRSRRVKRFEGPPPTANGNAPRAVKARAAGLEVQLTRYRFHTTGERITFGQAVEAWWAWWTTAEVRKVKTGKEYRRLLDKRVLPDLGAKRLDRLTAGQLTTYYAGLRAKGLSPESVKRVHERVSAVLSYAEVQSWVPANAAKAARRPSEKKRPPTRPTVEQVDRLVAASPPMLARAIFVAVGLGIRRGELTALRWSSVRWPEQEVVITTSVGDRTTGFAVEATKTHQERRVPMASFVESAIAEQQAEQRALAERFGARLVDDPWLWSRQPDGSGPPNPDYFSGAEARARKKAGIGGVRLHDLRHAFASWLISLGVPVTEVSGLLGHADTSMTLRTYAGSDPTRQGARDAIARLEELGLRRRPAGELTPGEVGG